MNVNKELLRTLLRELCEINGASGNEEKVREYIYEKIKDKCACEILPSGCLIARYTGRKRASKRLMISAHMDEVGLIITGINPDGTLSFNCVGGVEADAVIGRQVMTECGIYGSVGSKAVHNMSEEERKAPPKFDGLYIDIGAADKAEAQKHIRPGDYAYFTCGYHRSPDGYIRSKAVDDRAGCAMMMAMILEDIPEYDCIFSFVTQEEIGLRGARTAAFYSEPEFAVVLEATTAADIPLSEGDKRCCILGKGPVSSYMDRSTVYDRELYRFTQKIAEENHLPVQTKMLIAGGNDSGAIHISRSGVRTAAISVPCRYLHTPCCVIDEKDYFDSFALACALTDAVQENF